MTQKIYFYVIIKRIGNIYIYELCTFIYIKVMNNNPKWKQPKGLPLMTR